MLKNILWNDLINEKFIIIDINDNLQKKYNAVIIKYDDKKNVLIRYLDNPYYEHRKWWTGNKDNIPGLNPQIYNAIFLGDSQNDMDGLLPEDFIEDGYDDIINYNKEYYRFYYSSLEYPYLDGIQGNVHVYNYYISIYNNCLLRNEIPECIKSKILITNPKMIEINDSIKGIIEMMPITFSPEINEYNKYRGDKTAENDYIKIFKKQLSYLITNNFINKYKNIYKEILNEDEINMVKIDLKKGYKNKNIIKIIPYLIKYHLTIFDCYENDYNIIDYGICFNKKIYMLKYINKWYIIL